MDDQQSTFKVVDRRPFNPDGTPRELSPEEKEEAERAAKAAAAAEAKSRLEPPEPATATQPSPSPSQQTRTKATSTPRAERQQAGSAGDPMDDPASFLSLIMSLASNAAASLGMMPHPVTGETGVELKTAKHWIDVLGMLELKTRGNLDPQEEHVLESLLA